MNLKNQLGKRIQDLRKAQKLTQEMLAEKLISILPVLVK